ncbi:hypothetical protein [Rubripirellula obstinata]|nr:hypothetical protein [Rubripirellula obstinata]
MNFKNALGFGVVLGIAIGWELRGQLPNAVCLTVAVFFATFSALAGTVLSRADSARIAMQDARHVGRLHKIYLCSGIMSVLAWFLSVLVVGFPLFALIGFLSV